MTDPRPKYPGRTDDDPYCIDLYCPSFFSCRRASWEPWQGGPATISFMEMPDKLLGGLLCSWFQPADFNPAAQGGEARRAETGTGSVHEHPVGQRPMRPDWTTESELNTRLSLRKLHRQTERQIMGREK